MNFPLPEIGEGVYEAELIEWLVKPGDKVRRGTGLIMVMTDKANMEVPASFAGTIENCLVAIGNKIRVGQIILDYQPENATEPVSIGEAVAKQTISNSDSLHDRHRSDSEKTQSVGAPSNYSPFIEKENSTRAVMNPGEKKENSISSLVSPQNSPKGIRGEIPKVATPVSADSQRIDVDHNEKGTSALDRLPPAAPSIRRMARQLGINLSGIQGSGPGGRILIDDLSRSIHEQSKSSIISETANVDSVKSKSSDKNRGEFSVGKAGTRIPYQGLRRMIGDHLLATKDRVPSFSYVDEIDVSELVRLKQSLSVPCKERGIKLTYLAFFVKAVVQALKAVPLANATLDEAEQHIILHDRYDIGIAVATLTGLVVPVIKEADKKDVFTIARQIDQLGMAAKSGKIRREDLKGSTFTITSIGNIGGLISTPILNYPEVGILGLGKVVRRPVYNDQNQIVPADIIYLSLTFDHRVVDGAIAALFGNAVRDAIQLAGSFLIPDQV